MNIHKTTVYAAAFIQTYFLFADTLIFSVIIYEALFVLAIILSSPELQTCLIS